ncbi:MAG: GTPase HflX [Firmicutes bacterium]|nr:GTPase HflX [Bacillota bacterium]
MTKACLVALQTRQTDWQIQESLEELAELATDAGLEVIDTFIQKRDRPAPGTFIGKGKAIEIGKLLEEDSIVIFDDELTPAQQGNLSDLMDAPVLDRTQLILDIFASRAQSAEGKLQVELAQLKYLLPRLVGHGQALSRLGGGIGTRGPGETKLETDRRRIRGRIADLENELEKIEKVRAIHRTGRRRQATPLVSLVGYTNAGKSSLLARLTGEKVYVADQLFATLDPTIRRWELKDNNWVYLTDTVGFIRRLPHTLIAAFRATLEEVLQADLLLHIIDASHPQMAEQKEAVEKVLQEIGATQDIICVYNKIDKVAEPVVVTKDSVGVSALTGQNLDLLAEVVFEYFNRKSSVRQYLFPFDQLAKASFLREKAEVTNEEYTQDGVVLTVRVNPEIAKYLINWEIIR